MLVVPGDGPRAATAAGPVQQVPNALRDFVKFAANDGQGSCEPLGYIPLPRAVADKVLAAVDQVTVAAR